MRKTFIYTLGFLILILSCKNRHHKEIQVDQSINKKTSFNNLFIDSNTINRFLDKHSEYSKYNKQYSDFYKLRNYQCAWFDSSGIGEQAYNFMNLIASAADTYSDSSLYNKKLANEVDEFKTDTSGTSIKTTQDIVETELKLTGTIFFICFKNLWRHRYKY
jgi:hypothetical protein